LTQPFFQCLGADLENDVAEFEFGIAEDLTIWLANQKPSHLHDLIFGQLTNPLSQRLGIRFLFGRQRKTSG
jgi:hypothetical protein